MRFSNVALCALLVSGASAAMAADPVVYSSVPDLTNHNNNAWCSDCYGGGSYEPLDQFTLGSAASITSLDLAQYAGYDTGSFTLEIYNSDHSAILFSQALSGTNTGGTIYNASVTGLNLAAGTYWAGFIAPRLAIWGFDTGNGSLIETTPHTGQQTNDYLGGNTGYIFYGTSASSPTPEPASWALMLGGFGLVGGAMRSRRAKTAVSFG